MSTDQDLLRAAEDILNYTFNDPAILDEAVTHASVAGDRLSSNERMEFLGDAVLGMVICDYIYRTYPDMLEGDMTKVKSSVVSRRSCAIVARDLGLDSLLRLGKGMTTRNGIPRSLSAAVFESIIAAIHLDGGFDQARQFILEHMTPLVEQAVRNGHQHNFKSILQQYSQQEFGRTATYVMLDKNGPDHAKCFQVCVELEGRRFEPSWAPSKKQAEQRAALNALLELGAVTVDDESDEIALSEALLAT